MNINKNQAKCKSFKKLNLFCANYFKDISNSSLRDYGTISFFFSQSILILGTWILVDVFQNKVLLRQMVWIHTILSVYTEYVRMFLVIKFWVYQSSLEFLLYIGNITEIPVYNKSIRTTYIRSFISYLAFLSIYTHGNFSVCSPRLVTNFSTNSWNISV